MLFGRRRHGPIVDIDLPLDIQAAQRLAFWMDNAIEIPFIRRRIGWDAIAGLVPGAGDIAMALIGVYMIWIGWRYQLPRRVMVHMALNLVFDAVSGSIPLVGDIFDATFKAHARNAQLLVEAYRNQLEPGQVTVNMSSPLRHPHR